MRCALWPGIVLAGLLLPGCYRSHALEGDRGPGAMPPDAMPPDAMPPDAMPIDPVGTGPWLAYAVAARDADRGTAAVVATQLDGRRTVVVEDGVALRDGAWSPIGRALALALEPRSEHRLVLARFDDTGVVERRAWRPPGDTIVSRLTWSPQGRQLASTVGIGEQVLHIHDVDAWEEPLVVHEGRGITLVTWSPSGHALAFMADDDGDRTIYVARADEGFVPRAVALPPDGHPRYELGLSATPWSPDGRWLAFEVHLRTAPSLHHRIFVAGDRELRAFLVSPALRDEHLSASHPSWSPNATRLAYADSGPGPVGPMDRSWYVVDPIEGATTSPVRLAAREASLHWISPEQVVSIESVVGDTRGTRLDLGPDGAERTALFSLPGDLLGVALHAEPLRGVLQVQSGRRSRVLWAWEASRGAPVEVAMPELAFLDERGWSPRGDRLAFVVSEGAGYAVFEVRFPARELVRIHDGARRWAMTSPDWTRPWSAGGEAYFFELDDDGLAVRDVRSSETHVLVDGDRIAHAIGWEQVRTR